MTEGSLAETETLLRTAYDRLNMIQTKEPLAEAATQLIRCAMDGVALLSRPEISTAGEMLSCARAAVTVATYAIREVDGEIRRRPPAIRRAAS